MHRSDIGMLKINQRHNSLKIYNTKFICKNTRDSLVFFTYKSFQFDFYKMIELIGQIQQNKIKKQ